MKITKEEAQKLDALYSVANETDSDNAWNAVKEYYDLLSSKYNFDPEKVSISRIGVVMRLKYCFKCKEVATSPDGVIYVRARGNNGKWTNQPICWSCYAKFYPEKAYKELL